MNIINKNNNNDITDDGYPISCPDNEPISFCNTARLNRILPCFTQHIEFPQSFLNELDWKCDKMYENATPTVTPLKLTNSGKLTPRAKDVFTEMFYRFGIVKKGYLSRDELQKLQICCHPKEPLSKEELNFFFKKFQTENGFLTLKGFLELYYRESYQHPKNVWDELNILGYNKSLILSNEEGYKWLSPKRWNLSMDRSLVEYVNNLSELTGKPPYEITANELNININNLSEYPLLIHLPVVAIKLRFSVIKLFNLLVQKALHFVDLTQLDIVNTMAQRLCEVRYLIFYKTKVDFLDVILARTVSNKPPPSINVSRLRGLLKGPRDRIGLLLSTGSDTSSEDVPVFIQAFEQLNDLDPEVLRQNERAFKVTLKGERVEGEVGPYQETISQLCAELQPFEDSHDHHSDHQDEGSSSSSSLLLSSSLGSSSSDLNNININNNNNINNNSQEVDLFIPCPNRQQASEQIGIGENRDKYIPKPSAKNSKYLKMFEFVGKLIGISISTKSILSLNLPPIFWKPLVGLNLTLKDLKAIDFSTVNSRLELLNYDKDSFKDKVFNNWTCLLSDGTEIELKIGGKELSVQWEEREEYVKKYFECRLNESKEQMDAIALGIGSIIPLCLLSLFTWQDLEMRVCGKTEINLDVLKRNTRYREVNENDPHIVYFWNSLEKFSQRERMMFLRFSWGRSRLPSESELKREQMKIFPFPCDDPDVRLPHAETCFFNLKLPAYSKEEIMYEKLLYAITQTKSIDADVQADPLGRGAFGGLQAFGRGGLRNSGSPGSFAYSTGGRRGRGRGF